MARTPSTQPTDGELEILNVLWSAGRADLGTIRAALQQKRPVATTTIATMLKLMRDKGLVDRADDLRVRLVGQDHAQGGAARTDRPARGPCLRRVGAWPGRAEHASRRASSAQDRQEIRRLLDEGERKTRAKKGETRS